MTRFTRREAFSVAAGAAAATALPQPTRAATPPAGKQAAGWYRYKIGSMEVTVATDGVARFKMAEDHVINIKKDVVNAALAEVFMEKDMMTTPYNPDLSEHRLQARRYRYRHRRGQLQEEQRRRRTIHYPVSYTHLTLPTKRIV